MKTQHTPGQWKCTPEPEYGRIIIEPAEAGRYVSYVAVVEQRGCRDAQQMEANAALIAAAPDLLKACLLAVESQRLTLGQRNAVIAAITQATENQP